MKQRFSTSLGAPVCCRSPRSQPESQLSCKGWGVCQRNRAGEQHGGARSQPTAPVSFPVLSALSCCTVPFHASPDPPAHLWQLPPRSPLLIHAVASMVVTWAWTQPPTPFVFIIYINMVSWNEIFIFMENQSASLFPSNSYPDYKWENITSIVTEDCDFLSLNV